MYHLILANKQHAQQIADKISNTGYWRAGIEGNTLGLDYRTFMVEYVVVPQLPFTYVLVEDGREDIVRGVLICSSVEELESQPHYEQYLSPAVKKIFKAVGEIKFPGGLVISYLTLDKALRGKKLGKKMFQLAESQAKQQGFDNISLTVWSFSTDAVKFYYAMGMMATRTILCEAPIELPILLMQKNTIITRMTNYFETSAYDNLHFSSS